MSAPQYGLTPEEWSKLENSARRWLFDGVPNGWQLQQLVVYTTMDADIAELHQQIVEAKAQAFDDYLDAFLRMAEQYANGEDRL